MKISQFYELNDLWLQVQLKLTKIYEFILSSFKELRSFTISQSSLRSSKQSSSGHRSHLPGEESMSSKLARLKTSFFGQTPGNTPSGSSGTNSADKLDTTASAPKKSRPPVRYDLPSDSEPGEHGRPWTLYRAPTPLPKFGTDEYYKVIKSNNPSPTTTDQSEVGSTPDDISSREELVNAQKNVNDNVPFMKRSITGEFNPMEPHGKHSHREKFRMNLN